MFTQSLHFKRCSILPFLCFGVSSPQYIQAFSLLIATDFIDELGDGEPEAFELTMPVFVTCAEAPLIDGDILLVWRTE